MRAALLILTMLPSFTYAQELTVLELQARVQQLLAQISAIELELDVAESHKTTTPSCPALTRTLRSGSMGGDVRALQSFLMKTADFPTGETSAYFGPKTLLAVRSFQCRELGLCTERDAGYGIVGPRTRAAITSACEAGFSYNSAKDPAGSASFGAPVCGQPPVPTCPEGQSCVTVLPSAQTYADDAAREQAGAALVHAGPCACGDNGISCHATEAAACSFWGRRVAHGETVAAFRQGLVASISLCQSEARECVNGTLSGSYAYATCAQQ